MIIGPYISTIPVRVRIEDGITATELLSKVQDHYLAAVPFRDCRSAIYCTEVYKLAIVGRSQYRCQ